MNLALLASLLEDEAGEYDPLPVDSGVYDPAGEFEA
jgi:hypothetical protein